MVLIVAVFFAGVLMGATSLWFYHKGAVRRLWRVAKASEDYAVEMTERMSEERPSFGAEV